jgi:hypothetical protein
VSSDLEEKRLAWDEVPKECCTPARGRRCERVVGYACAVYWILAAVFIVIALTHPRLRPLGIVGCIILGTMLAWGMVQRLRSEDPSQAPAAQQRGKPASPATALRSVPLTMVVAQDLGMSGSGAPFELRGRIANNTNDVMLRSVTIRVTRRDCYEGALDPSGCVRLWQDEHWIAITVPAGQSRDFVEAIWMHGNAPRPRGTVQDMFELIAATGEGGAEVEKPDK